MKKLPLSILFFLLAGSLASAAPVGLSSLAPVPSVPELASAGYKLKFSDEFDGKALDLTKWDYRTDSKMWSTQLPANVTVADGMLNLNLKKENAGGKNHTGAGIISKGRFKYGYYETRMKTPPGAGWHTSFWMMKHNGSCGTNGQSTAVELDVIENDSVNSFHYGVNTHQWNPKPHKTFGNKGVTTPSLCADFHVFGCEYTAKSVKYFFDGKLVQNVDATKFPHCDVNIWLTSIASSLGKTKAVDESKLPAVAQYDYVRFFEK